MRFLQSSIFFMLLLVVPQLSAQSWEVSGRVLNNRDGKAIDFVNVYVDETPYGTYTNQNGEFLLVLKPLNEEIKLVFTHLGYKKKIVRIAPSDFNGGKWSGTVRMESNQIDISTVPIYSTRIPPDTICGFESSNVGDYAFIDDYTLLLLYEKEKRWKRQDEVDQTIYSGCSLVLLDEDKILVDSLALDDVAFGFYTDYLDMVFLERSGYYYHVDVEHQNIVLGQMDEEEFDELIAPVIDTVGDYVYISTYDADYPAFEYYVYNTKDSTYRSLHWVVDEPLMDLFRSEYKYLDGRGKLEAYKYELKSGIDKEIVAAYMTGFPSDVYYKSLYAPVFLREDTILVFDHYKDKLYTIDGQHNKVDSTLIAYHKGKEGRNWDDKLIQDEKLGTIYSVYKKNGYISLSELSTGDGTVNGQFRLYYKFVENMHIKGGYIHYIYRPFESSQKKFLYRERIQFKSS